MTQEDIQSELERRAEEDRWNARLIGKTVQGVMSDWLKKTYGERLSMREKLSYSVSMRAIVAEEISWQRWVNND